MTTMRSIDVTCPCCGHEFQSKQWMSTNTFGPLTTDLYKYARGFQVIEFGLDMCPSCTYASENMSEEKDIPEKTKQFVHEHLKTRPRGTPSRTPWISYEHCALIKEFEGEGPWEAACMYLSAAWCARVKLGGWFKSSTAEVDMRHKVIEYLRRAIDGSAVPEHSICRAHYLLGENLRRVNESEEASLWFERTRSLDPNFPQFRMFNALAEQQSTRPKKHITGNLLQQLQVWAEEEKPEEPPEVIAEREKRIEEIEKLMKERADEPMSTGCMVVVTILILLAIISYMFIADRESWTSKPLLHKVVFHSAVGIDLIPYTGEVQVLGPKDKRPEDSLLIGSLYVTGRGTGSSFRSALIERARGIGGDTLLIHNLNPVAMSNGRFYMSAEAFKKVSGPE